VFTTDQGFAVAVDDVPFRDLATWQPSDLVPNRLGSLNKFVAQVVLRTLLVGEDMVNTLKQSLQLPADIAPGLHVFLCSDFVGVLGRLHAVAEGAWERFASIDL
jgi:hypothetical protein